MTRLPNVGEIWEHYKGGQYIVLDVVYSAEAENLGIRIVYGEFGKADRPAFSRPIENFLDLVPGHGSRFKRYGC